MSVLDFLHRRQEARHAEHVTAWGRYRQLLESFVNGGEVDATEADEIIAAAGKSESELQSDAETLANRIAWREQIDDAAAAKVEQKDALDELSALDEKVRAYHRKIQPAIDAARERWLSAGARTGADSLARRRLIESVQDPAITSRLEILTAERIDAADEAKAAKERLQESAVEYHRHRVEAAERRLREVHEGDLVSHREATEARHTHKARLDEAEKAAKPWSEKLESAERRLAEIETETERLTEQALQP